MAGYSSGTDNRLTFDGTYTYTYNAEGDLTQKLSTTATWTYGWDNMNRMVGVKEVTTTGTQLSVSYSYDVLNNRVEDDTWKPGTGTVTVRHAYDGNNIWADVTTTNTLLARYVYGDAVDQVWARAIPAGLTNSGVGWYLTDREGSVRDIMDSSSVIQDHIDYDGYGNATHTTISFADQFGYAGGLYSYDTKMEQFGARWYDAATGRWVSEDPMGFVGGDKHLYRYCGNDATNATDPTGLKEDLDYELYKTHKGYEGAYAWGVNWVVNKDSPCFKRGGVIFQHIVVTINVTRGRVTVSPVWEPRILDWVEAWTVDDKGKVEPFVGLPADAIKGLGESGVGGLAGERANDWFWAGFAGTLVKNDPGDGNWSYTATTTGTVTIDAKATYFGGITLRGIAGIAFRPGTVLGNGAGGLQSFNTDTPAAAAALEEAVERAVNNADGSVSDTVHRVATVTWQPGKAMFKTRNGPPKTQVTNNTTYER
jgi:RHS repeat-associated protein